MLFIVDKKTTYGVLLSCYIQRVETKLTSVWQDAKALLQLLYISNHYTETHELFSNSPPFDVIKNEEVISITIVSA